MKTRRHFLRTLGTIGAIFLAGGSHALAKPRPKPTAKPVKPKTPPKSPTRKPKPPKKNRTVKKPVPSTRTANTAFRSSRRNGGKIASHRGLSKNSLRKKANGLHTQAKLRKQKKASLQKHEKQYLKKGANASTYWSLRGQKQAYTAMERNHRHKIEAFKNSNLNHLTVTHKQKAKVGTVYNTKTGKFTSSGNTFWMFRKDAKGNPYLFNTYLRND
ncbi:MAG: hypothetical protein ACSHXY_01180 [Alphaproteobacteria bacterium]